MKVRALLINISLALLLAAGILFFSSTKVAANSTGCVCHQYGAYPGSLCSSWGGYGKSCPPNQCGYYTCYGVWCYIQCDASNCGQTITCSCGNSTTCPACPRSCPGYESCPTACGNSASDRADGNCGTHHCNATGSCCAGYVNCPTGCGHSASDQPDGNCSTHHCDATGSCCAGYVNCPTACGSAASNQPDGNCGTHYCAAINPPAYVACPTACGTGASNQPDGTCGGTHYCGATAPCCNPNFNMTITDTNSSGNCNNAVFTLSGLPGTHNQPSGGNINTVTNNSSTLCTNNNWPLQNPFSCGGVTNTSITWTHNWREFDGSQYSVNCSKSVTVNYPLITPPPCLTSSELNVNFTPQNIYYNDPVQKNTLFASYTLHSPDFTSLSQVTVASHNPAPGFVSCNTWTIDPVPGTLTVNNDQAICSPSQFGPYNFSYGYNLRHPTCTNITTFNCSATSPTVAGSYFPGFLQTEKGDAYLGGPFPDPNNMPADQIRYPLQRPAISMSTYTFSSNQVGNTIYLPNGAVCTSAPAVCSFKNYLLFNYNDNNVPGTNNWYAVIKNRMDQDLTATKDPNTYNNPTWNSGAPFFDTSKTVINVTNNLTVNSGATCQGKNIILVSGDLIINPDFTYQGDNGCLFVVNGRTTINDSYGSTSRQDTVQAFIITNTISTPLRSSPAATKDNWLNIKGGVITTNLTDRNINANFWGRNVNYNSAHNTYQTQPSELLTYEGARYINFFGQYLNDSSLLSIRELQYNP